MMMIEPDPTDVSPTSSPPTSPTITVGMIRTANGGRLSRGSPPTIRASSERRPCSQALNTMALAASRSVHPRNSFVRFSTCSLSPTLWMMKTPAKAIGIDPMHSHPTSGQRTVRRRMWTPPPIGFITIAATRSDETAAVGLIPKKITRIGVIKAPPPIPVIPTVNPTIAPARTMPQSMCIGRVYGRSGSADSRSVD